MSARPNTEKEPNMIPHYMRPLLFRRIEAECVCGEPADVRLFLFYRYPRERFEPDAMDPWYVHGCRPIATCGSTGCEADFYAETLAIIPDADIAVHTTPGGGIFLAEDADDD